MKKANELEEKFEWLQASKCYKKAFEILSEEKDFVNVGNLAERLGFCYFKAADQAVTNKEFRKLLEKAADAYKKELELLEGIVVENKRIEITHAQALIAYVEALLERRPLEKKKLLDYWWILENQVILAYERISDLSYAGKVCNEVLEYSRSNLFWIASNYSEWERNKKDFVNLAEKAIQIFSKLHDEYELARAYFLATYYYSFGGGYGLPEEQFQQMQKAQEYSKKALEVSRKIGNPYLIGESYRTKSWGIQLSLRASKLMIEAYNKAIKYGKIAKNNYVITGGKKLLAFMLSTQSNVLEDPVEQKENLRKAIKLNQEAIRLAEISENILYLWIGYRDYNIAVNNLASIETDSKIKQDLLEMAIKVNQEGMERLRGWNFLSGDLLLSMSYSLQLISKTKSEIEEKRKLLQKSKHYIKKHITFQEKMRPIQYEITAVSYFELATIHNDLATIETNNKQKVELLKLAVGSIEKAIVMAEKVGSIVEGTRLTMGFGGRFYDLLGNLLAQINLISKHENTLLRAIESYQKAILHFEKTEMTTHIAESNWHIAQIHDKLGEYQKASKNYELAAQAYDRSSKKISHLSDFYTNYTNYMLAWSQIEQAKYTHSIEEYSKAQQHYEVAAELHEKIDSWNYLAPNYLAWAEMEKAESQSRKENSKEARDAFQKALEIFTTAEKSIKLKIGEVTSTEEKDLNQRLLVSSDLRRKYCQARTLLEDAKLLDREGKYLQSSKSYKEAAQNVKSIIKKVDSEAERKELQYIAILCQAWEKMATAEEKTSAESYLEAAELFEKAKDHCYTKKASLWVLGNSNFCRGLRAGIKYQTTLSLSDNALAKRHIENAAANYLQAGFKNASEYAKATLRLFDAYVFVSQAQNEIEPEKKARQYQMAEKLLQMSSDSFLKAKQTEKINQVNQILATVREEKSVALSLSEVMLAPSIVSSTLSFSAPSPTNEVSVGLEKFQHANVQANLIAGLKKVKVGESFCLSVEFVNAGKEPALLTRVEDFVPADFIVVQKPEIYRLEDNCLNMKGKQIAPLKLVEAKLVLQPSKKGVYHLRPTVHYLDELGQNKSLQLKSIEIKVEEVVLEDRVSTGTKELDSLLLGGVPKEYAVVLTGSPSDERDFLIKNFLVDGTRRGQPVFFVSTEANDLEDLLNKPGFNLFLCNPKPKIDVPDLPNVTKLRSKTDINNLNMALARESRNLQAAQGSRRLCVGIVSDVLLEFGATTARKWVSELLTDLGSKGFTILAVLDPSMHPSDHTNAISNLFDGEISISQSEDPQECKKSVQVKKLRGQDYIKNPICLTKP